MELTYEQIRNLDRIYTIAVQYQSEIAESVGITIEPGTSIVEAVPLNIKLAYESLHYNEVCALSFNVGLDDVLLFQYQVRNDLGLNKYSAEEIVDDIYKSLPKWWAKNKHHYSDEFRQKVEQFIEDYKLNG